MTSLRRPLPLALAARAMTRSIQARTGGTPSPSLSRSDWPTDWPTARFAPLIAWCLEHIVTGTSPMWTQASHDLGRPVEEPEAVGAWWVALACAEAAAARCEPKNRLPPMVPGHTTAEVVEEALRLACGTHMPPEEAARELARSVGLSIAPGWSPDALVALCWGAQWMVGAPDWVAPNADWARTCRLVSPHGASLLGCVREVLPKERRDPLVPTTEQQDFLRQVVPVLARVAGRMFATAGTSGGTDMTPPQLWAFARAAVPFFVDQISSARTMWPEMMMGALVQSWPNACYVLIDWAAILRSEGVIDPANASAAELAATIKEKLLKDHPNSGGDWSLAWMDQEGAPDLLAALAYHDAQEHTHDRQHELARSQRVREWEDYRKRPQTHRRFTAPGAPLRCPLLEGVRRTGSDDGVGVVARLGLADKANKRRTSADWMNSDPNDWAEAAARQWRGFLDAYHRAALVMAVAREMGPPEFAHALDAAAARVMAEQKDGFVPSPLIDTTVLVERMTWTVPMGRQRAAWCRAALMDHVHQTARADSAHPLWSAIGDNRAAWWSNRPTADDTRSVSVFPDDHIDPPPSDPEAVVMAEEDEGHAGRAHAPEGVNPLPVDAGAERATTPPDGARLLVGTWPVDEPKAADKLVARALRPHFPEAAAQVGAAALDLWRPFSRPPERADLDALVRDFPNMTEVVRVAARAAALARRTNGAMMMPPLLLVGPPGVGKTAFARRWARLTGAGFQLVDLGALTAGWVLAGSNPQWRDAKPGKVAEALLAGPTANPVVVHDELDKGCAAGEHKNHPPTAVLYNLLEPETAQAFCDEYLDVPMDARYVSWIATANDVRAIPDALLSRFRVIDVPAPTAEQMEAVVASVWASCRARPGLAACLPEAPPPEVVAALLGGNDNVRLLRRRIEDTIGRAAERDRCLEAASDDRMLHVTAADVADPEDVPRWRVGF